MKFTDYKEAEDNREVVAELFHMEGDEKAVCLNIVDVDGYVVTLYYDGEVIRQKPFNTGSASIKKFYRGDSVTITF